MGVTRACTLRPVPFMVDLSNLAPVTSSFAHTPSVEPLGSHRSAINCDPAGTWISKKFFKFVHGTFWLRIVALTLMQNRSGIHEFSSHMKSFRTSLKVANTFTSAEIHMTHSYHSTGSCRLGL